MKNAVSGSRVGDPVVCLKNGELKTEVLRKVRGPSRKPGVPFVFAKI